MNNYRHVPRPIKEMVKQHPSLLSAYNRVCKLPNNLLATLNKYGSGYDKKYYEDGKVDNTDYQTGAAHPVILSAALYGVRYDSFEGVSPLVNTMVGRDMAEQARILGTLIQHTPKHVLDIGGERGELSLLLGLCGIKTTMIDPSEGSRWFVQKLSKVHDHNIHHINEPLGVGWKSLDDKPDSIILCESIEHIPVSELDVVLDSIGSCRMVVVNHLDFWPIIRHHGQLGTTYVQ